jgi:hypothetical protein
VIYPDVTAGERDSLEQFLDFHRNGVLKTLDEVSQYRGHIDVLMDAVRQARPSR